MRDVGDEHPLRTDIEDTHDQAGSVFIDADNRRDVAGIGGENQGIERFETMRTMLGVEHHIVIPGVAQNLHQCRLGSPK
jgi:hypothetical protein